LNGQEIGWPKNPDAYCDTVGAIHYGVGTVLGSTDNSSAFLYGNGFPFNFQANVGFKVEFKYWDSLNDTIYYSTTLYVVRGDVSTIIGNTTVPYIIHVETPRNPCRSCENFLISSVSSGGPMGITVIPDGEVCRPGMHLTK